MVPLTSKTEGDGVILRGITLIFPNGGLCSFLDFKKTITINQKLIKTNREAINTVVKLFFLISLETGIFKVLTTNCVTKCGCHGNHKSREHDAIF